MIRDPSDGSVKTPEEISPDANDINAVSAKRRSKEITSGLAPIDKDHANEAARLKRSREWLEEYQKRSKCTGQ
ncbi:hypothetical protein BEL01nite_58380 [Bradyrhizobium elkanii]|nr:hypothetical protein BEL01nite_58380 [Bradyrhizobium elkanii]